MLVWMCRLWPSLLRSARIVKPDTILWASSRLSHLLALEIRPRVRATPVSRELRELIHRMSKENLL